MYWVNARDGVIIKFWKYISNIYLKKKQLKWVVTLQKNFLMPTKIIDELIFEPISVDTSVANT